MTRSKQVNRAAAGAAPARKTKISGWERSIFNKADHKKVKRMGLLTDEDSSRFPGDEMIPCPGDG